MIALLVILTATLHFVLTKPSYINSVPVFNEGFGVPVVNVYLTQIPEDVTYFKAEYFSRKSPKKQAEPEQLPKTNESSSYGSDAFISNSSAENSASSTTPPPTIVLSISNASESNSSISVSEQNKTEVNKHEKQNINPKPFLEYVYYPTVILLIPSVQHLYPSSAANVFALPKIIKSPVIDQTDKLPVTYDIPLRYTNTW